MDTPAIARHLRSIFPDSGIDGVWLSPSGTLSFTLVNIFDKRTYHCAYKQAAWYGLSHEQIIDKALCAIETDIKERKQNEVP